MLNLIFVRTLNCDETLEKSSPCLVLRFKIEICITSVEATSFEIPPLVFPSFCYSSRGFGEGGLRKRGAEERGSAAPNTAIKGPIVRVLRAQSWSCLRRFVS